MQNGMSLDNLFSSSVSQSLSQTGNSNGVNPSSSRSDPINNINTDAPESSFSTMLDNQVNKLEDNSGNNIQDSTVKTMRAEEPQVKEQPAVQMTDEEAYAMQKELEDLNKEAEDIINYICALLGISPETAKESLAQLLMDAELLNGESFKMLSDLLNSNANNVPVIKMQEIVSLLQQTADYLTSLDGNNPDEQLFSALAGKIISEKQNELKGFSNAVTTDSKPLADFARIVTIIKETAATGPVISNTPDNTIGTELTGEQNVLTGEQILAAANASEAEASTDTSQSGTDSSTASALSAAQTTQELNALSDQVTGADADNLGQAILVPPQPLSDTANGGPATSDGSTGKSIDIVEGLAPEPSQSGKNDIVESMNVNILENRESVGLESLAANDEPVKDTDLSTEFIKTGTLGGKAETGNVNTFNDVLNIQGSTIVDRAVKIDIISQIMDKAKMVLKGDQNVMKIQLQPARLGEVFMRISVEEGKVMAKVVTETLMAKEAIETSLFLLKESLGTQGIKIDKFNVFVGDKWQEQNGQSNYNNQAGSNKGNGYQNQSEFETVGADALTDPFALGDGFTDTGQINFIV